MGLKNATRLFGYDPAHGEEQIRGDDRQRVVATVLDTDAGVFRFIEDPSDGYRSYMDGPERLGDHGSVKVLGLSGAPDGVAISVVESAGYFDGFYLFLASEDDQEPHNGKWFLKIGTDNADDYYPYATEEYLPANLTGAGSA